ncbi:RhoGAP [Fasciola gigantica]|uniref:RhoGAP n=1 Tax=Fasciola gigantica TaxID=46835 RepID=A0A504YWX4_FASGI|nr:RhoGAP [Fasciola gigantica]
MIYHTEVNANVCRSSGQISRGFIVSKLYKTSPQKVERASKVMEYLITGFASADLFSRELIEYFTSETRTSISRVEKFKYEFRFPKDVPREKSIRLFMRLLLEEGKKHGFHLIHDAVSKELFENTDWETVCLPHVRSKQLGLTQSATSVKQDVPDSSASLTHIRPTICGDSHGKRRNAESDTNSVPGTLESLSFYRPPPLGHLTDKPMGDPVQQLSEKRTCVTTTPRQCHPLDTPDANDISRDSSFKRLDAVDSQKQQQQTVPGFRFRILNSTNRTGDQQQLQQPPHSTKALARPAAPTQACFNSVKRRQLERLQKRSDWFLSPPSGLRSSGLIHLNPTSSSMSSSPSNHESVTPVEGVVSTSTSRIGGVHRDASFTINVSLSSSGDCMPSAGVSTESGDSRHSELGPMVAWNDEDYVKNRAISRLHRLSDEDQDEIDHLVYTDPHRLWTNGSIACNRAAAESVKPLTSGEPYPTATSSPYGTCSPVNTHTPDKGNTNVGFQDEKENFPEVETRYYVVERYYGPEPRQPLLNRFGQYR